MDIGQGKSKKVKGKGSISQSYCIYLCIYNTVKQFGVKNRQNTGKLRGYRMRPEQELRNS